MAMKLHDYRWPEKIISLLAGPFIFFLAGMACIADYGEEQMIISSGKQQYLLSQPDEEYKLPGRLEEISGLDYLGEGILLCVEDEEGVLYFYSTREKDVTREIKFAESGDYEGVTHADNQAYVIRSDGKLYSFPLNQDDDLDAEKIETPFTAANDVEGLVMGFRNDELLIACKENPEVEDNKVEGRAVYAFNLVKNELDIDPAIRLTSEAFREALKKLDLKPVHFMPFKPSGIAIHPLSKDVFILGSVGKLLIVLNKSGKIIDAAPLSRKIFTQPEGICFDESGRLFISSEGAGKDGYILAYDPEIKRN